MLVPTESRETLPRAFSPDICRGQFLAGTTHPWGQARCEVSCCLAKCAGQPIVEPLRDPAEPEPDRGDAEARRLESYHPEGFGPETRDQKGARRRKQDVPRL